MFALNKPSPMREWFDVAVVLTLLATLRVCMQQVCAGAGVDGAVLVLCALVQLGLLSRRLPGESAHVCFIVAVSYASLLGDRRIIELASALLATTLALRLALGGCLFNVVEGEGSLSPRASWTPDAQLLSLFAIAVARLRCRPEVVLPAPLRALGLAGVTAYVLCTWS